MEAYTTEVVPVKVTHKDTYPAISQSRLALSQAGKTILITGGGTNVGYGIATSFAQAGASTIILAARRENVLQTAAETLKAAAEATNPTLAVSIRVVDVTSPSSVADLWKWIADSGMIVDVLVSNAGKGQPPGVVSILDLGAEETWKVYEINVRAPLLLGEHFAKQKRDDSKGPAVMINVASAVAWHHRLSQGVPVYAMTKNAGVMLMQQFALHVPAEKMRTVSIHPGLIETEKNKQLFDLVAPGWKPPYDPLELAADFCVWLASPEAAFLNGRYVQSDWDIEELQNGEAREKIDNDKWYLKVGITGLHPGN